MWCGLFPTRAMARAKKAVEDAANEKTGKILLFGEKMFDFFTELTQRFQWGEKQHVDEGRR